jgi:hypothetical protein
MPPFIRTVLALLAALPACAAAEHIAPEALRADLRFVTETVRATHPDLAHSVDPAALERAVRASDALLTGPMTRAQAWSALSIINPVFADAHLLVGFDDWRADSQRHLEQGEGFFPFEVFIDAHEDLRVRSLLGGAASVDAGAPIERINGRASRHVVRELLAHMHGDTAAFRARVLEQRFWFYYWKAYGTMPSFDLAFGSGAARPVAASRALPVVLRDDTQFEHQFRFALLPGRSALLTVGSFAWPDRQRFLAFTRDAFTQVRDADIETLVVDVRNNGGGDDSFWIDGILRYIADRPYRWGSHYLKRVTPGHADPGQRIGDVVSGSIASEVLPVSDDPLRFRGRLVVLIGTQSYSSTILFANTVQDYGFGVLAGVGGAVRTRQSGGVLRFVLPNSGLVLTCPRFVVSRPSGAASPVLLRPDLELDDDPLDDRAMVRAVLAMKVHLPLPAPARPAKLAPETSLP